MPDLKTQLQRVQTRISDAAISYGRDPASIQLLAVSKTKPVADILAAYDAGQSHFGENYLNEALEKISKLHHLGITWHFIGRIQGNKTKAIAENFDWVHSVCDIRHAQRLAQQRPPERGRLNLCIQVNLSGEESKGGVVPESVVETAKTMQQLPNIQLRGLMTLPRPETQLEQQRLPFKQLAQLYDRLNEIGLGLDTLSMGMTGDLEAAIAEGATIVRIGTALFGQR
jgi:hypothetical protein